MQEMTVRFRGDDARIRFISARPRLYFAIITALLPASSKSLSPGTEMRIGLRCDERLRFRLSLP